MSRHSVDLLLSPIPQSNELRLAQLRQTFSDLDCREPSLHEQPSPGGGVNLLCTTPGTAAAAAPKATGESGTILVLAHYEHQGAGQSAVDNWTGAITLPFLYHALTFVPRQHSFIFAEVNGEAGAKALYDSLSPAQRVDLKAIVALDSLGLGPVQYYINPNDTYGYGGYFLLRQLMLAAADEQIDAPVAGIPGVWFKTDVTREFRYHGVPAILLHSIGGSTHDLPGSTRDLASAIDHDAYYNTLTLLDYYITELDQPWHNKENTPSSGGRGRHR